MTLALHYYDQEPILRLGTIFLIFIIIIFAYISHFEKKKKKKEKKKEKKEISMKKFYIAERLTLLSAIARSMDDSKRCCGLWYVEREPEGT